MIKTTISLRESIEHPSRKEHVSRLVVPGDALAVRREAHELVLVLSEQPIGGGPECVDEVWIPLSNVRWTRRTVVEEPEPPKTIPEALDRMADAAGKKRGKKP